MKLFEALDPVLTDMNITLVISKNKDLITVMIVPVSKDPKNTTPFPAMNVTQNAATLDAELGDVIRTPMQQASDLMKVSTEYSKKIAETKDKTEKTATADKSKGSTVTSSSASPPAKTETKPAKPKAMVLPTNSLFSQEDLQPTPPVAATERDPAEIMQELSARDSSEE